MKKSLWPLLLGKKVDMYLQISKSTKFCSIGGGQGNYNDPSGIFGTWTTLIWRTWRKAGAASSRHDSKHQRHRQKTRHGSIHLIFREYKQWGATGHPCHTSCTSYPCRSTHTPYCKGASYWRYRWCLLCVRQPQTSPPVTTFSGDVDIVPTVDLYLVC